ncbi:hypothetical protein [Chryseobacterium mucoviscidosis]|uniref:hypothetical protein n=1 Tax=Chryseobacterium mucoviscidosis TaxID=1945581 RepID=UPI0031E3D32F
MTLQIKDSLIYNNERYLIHDELLEYKIRADKSLKPKSAGSFSACWRGYIATFEILENNIYLKDIHIKDDKERQRLLNGLFQDSQDYKLTWLNTLIVLYKNKLDGKTSLPELSIYESYEILTIQEGNLIDSKIFSHEEYINFKYNHYLNFINSDEYEIYKQSYIDTNTEYYKEKRELHPNLATWKKFVFNEDELKRSIKRHILSFIKKSIRKN